MDQVTMVLMLVISFAIPLLYHCYKIRGLTETVLFVIIVSGVGALVELVGVTSGGYEYTGQTLLIVSLFTGIGWISNTYVAMHTATFFLGGYNKDRLEIGDISKIAIVSGIFGVMYDLFIDPVAVAMKIWVWTHEGPWYGVPTPNFIGWFAIISFNVFGYYISLYYGKTQRQKIVTAILAACTISLLVVELMKLCAFLNIR